MPFDLFLSPQGVLHVRDVTASDGTGIDGPIGKRIHTAFSAGSAQGLLHLATTELQSSLVASFAYARDFARLYLTRLCQTPADAQSGVIPHPLCLSGNLYPKLSPQGRVQHEPLGKALKEYAGARSRLVLLSLLVPIQQATERSPLIKSWLSRAKSIIRWPGVPARLIGSCRISRFSRKAVLSSACRTGGNPAVRLALPLNVKIDARKRTALTVDALLDFSINVTLDGEPLTEGELKRLLQSVENLSALTGKWIELDRKKLADALEHWKEIEQDTRENGLPF
jgi:hypothetical protein